MKYNRNMNRSTFQFTPHFTPHLTLVLPFALPAPELAKDLLRAMQLPALAALLGRTSAHRFDRFDNASRVLPHEAWLAQKLGLGQAKQKADADAKANAQANTYPGAQACAPFAASAMQMLNQPAHDGYWFIVNPVHVQIARNHLLMDDARKLQLEDADARALYDCAKPYFDDIGQPLLYGDATTWFMRADAWEGLQAASPDAATGQNLAAWMPEGTGAQACRKLQNEIQMLWHEHPVNIARQARGLATINSFWVWGGSNAGPEAEVDTNGTNDTNDSKQLLLTGDCPPWLAALAVAGAGADLDAALNNAKGNADTVVVLGDLIEAGLASDWSHWLMQMQQLEQHWFAPALKGLMHGRIKRCTLVLSNRDALAEFSSSKNAQRKFWRKINLNRLLP